MARVGWWNRHLCNKLGRSLEAKWSLGKPVSNAIGSCLRPISFSTSFDASFNANKRCFFFINFLPPIPKDSTAFEPLVKLQSAYPDAKFGTCGSESTKGHTREVTADPRSYLLERSNNAGVSVQQGNALLDLVELKDMFVRYTQQPGVSIVRMMSTQSWNKTAKPPSGESEQSLMENEKPKQAPKSLVYSRKLPTPALLKHVEDIRTAASRYKEAMWLQLEAFWRRNYLIIVGISGLGVCFLLWRLMYGVASIFISLSEGAAKLGFLALAAAIVAFSGIYLRARYSINPDAIYRIAMRRLNSNAELLKILGAPLSGTDVRAYVMSGGGLRLKNFRPRFSSKRCFLIFPVQGSDNRGLVSLEIKKKKGQHHIKLLAVDIPTVGPDQRLYLIGDEDEYKIGGGLIGELRDPIVKAMAAQNEFDAQDEKEDEEDHKHY